MKYYDSTSLKIQDTEEKKTKKRYNEEVLNVRNIFYLILIPIMTLTILFQIIWFNIILHTAFCSIIITLSLAMMICDILQNDKQRAAVSIGIITFWLTNIVINLIKYFVV